MKTDLIGWALKLLEMAGPVRENLEATWPHLKAMASEAKAILVIWNGGKEVITASGPQSPDASRLASLLVGNGIPSVEANQLVTTFEAFDGRME